MNCFIKANKEILADIKQWFHALFNPTENDIKELKHAALGFLFFVIALSGLMACLIGSLVLSMYFYNDANEGAYLAVIGGILGILWLVYIGTIWTKCFVLK